MAQIIENFIPALLKAVVRNKGILDKREAARIFSPDLVELAVKRKDVGTRVIVLNAKKNNRVRIPCITVDWDGSEPIWLKRYREGQ